MKPVLTLLLLFNASSAIAGKYEFDCSNAQGDIKVFDQGQSILLGDKTSTVDISGIENNDFDHSGATYQIIPIKKPIILTLFEEHECREITEKTFAVTVSIQDQNKKEIEKTSLICHSLSVSTPYQHCR